MRLGTLNSKTEISERENCVFRFPGRTFPEFPEEPKHAIKLANNSPLTFPFATSSIRFFDCPLHHGEKHVATEQYHEPADELSQKTRTLARMLTSLIEEAEAINWYEQRISLEKDKQAKAIMQNAQKEEFKHFGMDLEFVLRQKPEFRETLQGILFTRGDIVKRGEAAEEKAD
jgi:hypothetical protein